MITNWPLKAELDDNPFHFLGGKFAMFQDLSSFSHHFPSFPIVSHDPPTPLKPFNKGPIEVHGRILCVAPRKKASFQVGRWTSVGGFEGGRNTKKARNSMNLIHWVVVSNIFYVHPYLGKIPILINIFQRGWNNQLVYIFDILLGEMEKRVCIKILYQ